QSHFVGTGLADRHHVGILEQRMEPLIGAVHDGLVGPFEIERADEGFAHPLVLERLPPCVEEPTLYPDRPAERDDVALDAPVTDRRKIITRRPDPRRELLPKQIVLGRERLKGELAVAVELVTDDVEIILSPRDRQIGAPPVLDALVFDEASDLEASDLVRTRPERRL